MAQEVHQYTDSAALGAWLLDDGDQAGKRPAFDANPIAGTKGPIGSDYAIRSGLLPKKIDDAGSDGGWNFSE